MSKVAYEQALRVLVDHAWDQEVRWPHIEAWAKNFKGDTLPQDQESLYAMFALSRFMYFGKRLVREMLKSLYRDQFKTSLMQRIRRNHAGTKDVALLQSAYQAELSATRFLGVGNPSESGAHLLYYFRQVNYLKKDLFADLAAAFVPKTVTTRTSREIVFTPVNGSVTRYVFFDDMVGSGDQATLYLTPYIRDMRKTVKDVDLRYMSLFATSEGLRKLNQPSMFDGNATCLFELDSTYRALTPDARYFLDAPDWFDMAVFERLVTEYGAKIAPDCKHGYGACQLLLGFSHNTPDNTLPIFWCEGGRIPWDPVFLRYDKKYN